MPAAAIKISQRLGSNLERIRRRFDQLTSNRSDILTASDRKAHSSIAFVDARLQEFSNVFHLTIKHERHGNAHQKLAAVLGSSRTSRAAAGKPLLPAASAVERDGGSGPRLSHGEAFGKTLDRSTDAEGIPWGQGVPWGEAPA
jgi:hypothetical protein